MRTFLLSELDGTNGFVINGIDSNDLLGVVSSAGDVNGDGIDDLIIGARSADPKGNNEAGESYVIFGGDRDFSTLNLSALDGTNGFVINGIDPEDYAGISVSSAGDMNGDGIDDLIIGARSADPIGNGEAGESYVLFGGDRDFGSSLDLVTLNNSTGFIINGIDAGDASGVSVSGAGDFNGDGIDDLIIGAYYGDAEDNQDTGESYLIFGSDRDFATDLNLFTLDGNNGFVINGIDPGDYAGISVSSAGDFNGDGFADLIIGAYYGDPNGNRDAGESYLIFGSDRDFEDSFDLSTLDGSNGFVLNGIDAGDFAGVSVSSAGDFNNDGFADLIIGANGGDANGNEDAGESYLLFGSDRNFSSSFDLSSLDGTNGFVLNGIDADDFSGFSVSGAGDLNGDDFDDLIIGARGADPLGNSEAGESYVIFGSDRNFGSSFDLSSLNGTNGFIINGIDTDDFSGFSVSGAGDLNGDNFDDLIIGANGADPNENESAGESYVIFGSEDLMAAPSETIDLYRFRNTTFSTGTYLFVGEAERDDILANPDFNQTFELEGDGNPAFTASTQPGEDLLPFFRLRSLATEGTFLFVSTAEYEAIFAEDSEQQDQWVREGLDEAGEDIPEFYLFGAGAGKGTPFNRFQNNENNTFLFASEAETEVINSDPNLSGAFSDQGGAFESL